MQSIEIRELQQADLNRGFLDVLAALTRVELSPEDAQKVFDRPRVNHFTYVAVADDRVIGTTSLFVEEKYIQAGGRAGHIEDVVVSPEAQGGGIGRQLVQFAVEQAKKMGCYKVILHCSEQVKPFYESLGFHQANIGMRIDLKK